MGLLNVQQTAEELGCKPTTLYDADFRAELGLTAVRIGRLLRFDQADLRRAIESRKEKLPATAAGDK